MFNLFKKKQPPKPVKEYYILEIQLKNKKYFTFRSETKNMPKEYRKILNWYSNRDSKMYTYIYNNGVLILDRDNINSVQVNKVKY